MEDGAAPHTSKKMMEFLNSHFSGERFISQNVQIVWLTKSHDLNPCDFILLGYLNDSLYRNALLQSVDELKKNFQWEARTINQYPVERMTHDFTTRLKRMVCRTRVVI